MCPFDSIFKIISRYYFFDQAVMESVFIFT